MNAPFKQIKLEEQEISRVTLSEKYLKDDETTAGELYDRVAKALASVEAPVKVAEIEAKFRQNLEFFIPAGRISSAAGTDIQATLINCFVQPVADAISGVVNGKPGIYVALLEAAETMRRGGGVGYDFSAIRPKGAKVKATRSNASGPVSYMRVFDRSCETVESAGARRGAQMGVLRCDHPDIVDFVGSKTKAGELTNFNISIAVTDEFMRAVEADASFDLVHVAEPSDETLSKGAHQRSDGKWVYHTLPARELWEIVMRNTYDYAEPGILFIDQMNRENNLGYCEVIEATNPCAEQPLPDYGCCCLGSINLTRFVLNPFAGCGLESFDFEGFAAACATSVRMLDNVLDTSYWPLPQQRLEAMSKRRIGLGFTGLGDTLVMMGIRYDTEEGLAFGAKISEAMRDAAYNASVDLSMEKGAFPSFDADKYLASGFAMRLPEAIRERIRIHGIRNSHLLSIAPTGTISLAFADNASNGIEPAFNWFYTRTKRMPDGSKKDYEVYDHAYRVYQAMGGDTNNLPASFVSATQMSGDAHLGMLKAVQPFIDTAISKTVNIDVDYPYEDFADLYFKAWKAGLKGLATYRPSDVRGAVLSTGPIAKAPETANDVDPMLVQIPARPSGDLEGVTSKITYQVGGEKTSIYVTVNFAVVNGILDGKPVSLERPIEFFMPANQTTEDTQWVSYSMRLMSMVGRAGNGGIAKALQNMRETVWDRGSVRLLGRDGKPLPGFHMSAVAAIGRAIQLILIKRGFLDADGNSIPSRVLAEKFARENGLVSEVPAEEAILPVIEQPAEPLATGRKCPECGEYHYVRVSGCDKCLKCGAIGSCG